jgi:secreted trypsin-like serine protease
LIDSADVDSGTASSREEKIMLRTNKDSPLSILAPLFLMAVSAGLVSGAAGQTTSQEVGDVHEIVGGQPAAAGKHRWITALKRGGHFCGAALIGDQWVVTAAHCLEGEKPAGLAVWVGGRDLRRPEEGKTAKVQQIFVHPNYNDDTLKNDIALIKLAKPIGAIPPVLQATAQTTNQLASPGKVATVSGWGALSENGSSPKLLHQVRLPIVSHAECNSPAAYDGEVFNNQICAGLRQGGKDACYGDSGGPLWVSKNGKDHLIGIVSWGEGCALPRKYGVYTRVAAYKQWIVNKLNGGEGPGPGPAPVPTSGPSCKGNCGGNAGNCWCDSELVHPESVHRGPVLLQRRVGRALRRHRG